MFGKVGTNNNSYGEPHWTGWLEIMMLSFFNKGFAECGIPVTVAFYLGINVYVGSNISEIVYIPNLTKPINKYFNNALRVKVRGGGRNLIG